MVSLLQRVPFSNAKKEPKGFAPAYGPLAKARGSFVTGPIRAQRLRFASLHLLPLCATASYGRCAPTPGSIPSLSLPKGQKIKSRIKSQSKSRSQIKRSQPSAAPTVGSRTTSRTGRLSGRLREQARSHKKQKSKAAQLPAAKPHHSTMSASSSAFDLRATSEG